MISKIQAHNLFSWEDLDFEIPSGVTLIEGFNFDDNTPEGSGKSSIPNIACWTLFGQIPKDVKIDEVVRQGEKSGWGKVILQNSTIVLRSRKPNDLYFQPKGAKDPIRGKDARETQQMIEAHIGMSFETFCQAVYFAQNYPNKFVTASETDKAKIISEIQDLQDFTEARKLAVKQAADSERALERLEETIKGKISLLTSTLKRIEDLNSIVQKAEEEKAEQTRRLQEEISILEAKLKDRVKEKDSLDVEALKSRLEELEKELDGLVEQSKEKHAEMASINSKTQQKKRIQSLIKDWERELASTEKQLRDLDIGEFDQSELDKEVSGLTSDIKSLEEAVSEVKAQLHSRDSNLSEATRLNAVLLRKRGELKKLEESITHFSESEGRLCPTCGAPLDQKHQEKHATELKSKRSVLSEEIDDLGKQYQSKISASNNSELDQTIKSLSKGLSEAKAQLASKQLEKVRREAALKEQKALQERRVHISSTLAEYLKDSDSIEVPDSGKLSWEIESLDRLYESRRESKKSILILIESAKRIHFEISSITAQLDRLKSDLKAIEEKSTEDLETKASGLEHDASVLDEELDALNFQKGEKFEELSRLNTLKESFSEVKSYVFRSILSELSRKANKYLVELFELPVQISFSNEGDDGELSKISAEVTIDGVARPLGLYSGGQFRRIQIAVDLALSEIIAARSHNPSNIRIIDEGMKDLSEGSMEKVLNLLATLKGSTIIIEHNSIFKSIVTNFFRVELRNGISREAHSANAAL